MLFISQQLFSADGGQVFNLWDPGQKSGGSAELGDYINYDSNYNYDLNLIVPHLKYPYRFASDLSSLHSTSGVESGLTLPLCL